MSAEAGRENAMSLRTPPTSTNTGQAASVKIKGAPSKYVKLNVGGTLFYTTIGTLTKLDNMLRAMFSGRMEVLTDSEGKVCPQNNCSYSNINMYSEGKVCPQNNCSYSNMFSEGKVCPQNNCAYSNILYMYSEGKVSPPNNCSYSNMISYKT